MNDEDLKIVYDLHPKGCYYMTNLNHPAIRALLRRWREEHGIAGGILSDAQRTQFELDILRPAYAQEAVAFARKVQDMMGGGKS